MKQFFLLTCLVLFSLSAVMLRADEDRTLLDATESALKQLVPQSAKLSLTNGILVETQASGEWPGFRTKKSVWNLEHCDRLVVSVTNHDNEMLHLYCRLDSPEVDWKTMAGTYTKSFSVPAGETGARIK